MILYRCFAWNDRARNGEPDAPIWVPRAFQGDGRHDNPEYFGCLYLADRAVSCILEQLARFRTQRLFPPMLRRRGLPLALAELDLPDEAMLVDLDDPLVLRREHLRPALVATRDRRITQPQARSLHERHPAAAGLRWWSTHEALWTNVTLFQRAAPSLRVRTVRVLTILDPDVEQAADRAGLQLA